MPHQVDRTKTARQNFIDLVNTGSTFTFTGTEFTEPTGVEEYTGDPEVSNTQVTLEAVSGSGFVGTKTVHYRRLAPGATRTAAALEYNITEEDTLTTLKEMICVEHNLISSEISLVGDLPTTIGQTTEINVFYDPFSYVYTGGTISVDVTLIAP
jgi:hypothetical protein